MEMRAQKRLGSIDLLRGAVMVLMALDHTRDFYSQLGDPTQLQTTTPALFFTRWVTHICAPVFMLLAGLSAFLSRKPAAELSPFLIRRGLWLVVLELTVVSFGWTFDWHLRVEILQVIWALGWSMVALAFLIRLPIWALFCFGLALVVGHNLGDRLHGDWIWSLLHDPRPYQLGTHRLIIVYPLIPWVGVMACGYAMGPLFLRPHRQRNLALLGIALTLGFVLLRAVNRYGDPHPWQPQTSPLFTVMSFVNCTKYPPSLDYLLMTLGPALLVLALLDGKAGGPLAVYGQVPLFFYLLHLPLIHGTSLLLSLIGRRPSGYGLGGVYLAWLVLVALLYWPCRAYARLKKRRRDLVWLRYL